MKDGRKSKSRKIGGKEKKDLNMKGSKYQLLCVIFSISGSFRLARGKKSFCLGKKNRKEKFRENVLMLGVLGYERTRARFENMAKANCSFMSYI